MALDEGLIKKLSAQTGVDEATTRKVCKALANMLVGKPAFDLSGPIVVSKPGRLSVPILPKRRPIDNEQWLKDNIGEIVYLVPKKKQGTAWKNFSEMGVHLTPAGDVDVSALIDRLRKGIII